MIAHFLPFEVYDTTVFDDYHFLYYQKIDRWSCIPSNLTRSSGCTDCI